MIKKKRGVRKQTTIRKMDEIAKSAGLYKRLIEFSGHAVYRYTFSGSKILFANSSFVKLLDLK